MIKDPTLAEVFELIGEEDSDIADDIFDFYSNICYKAPKEGEELDAYDKCMRLFCQEIKVNKIIPACYSNVSFISCKITEFVEKYKKAFRDHMNECYKVGYGYRPAEWDEDYTSDDEEFYDTYLVEFEGLITGNRCDDDYERMYNGIMAIKNQQEGQ